MTATEKVVDFVDGELRRFYVNVVVDQHMLEGIATKAELTKTVLPQYMRAAVAQLIMIVEGERVGEIRYPADWWQSIKARWFPSFLLRRFPVVETVWVIDRHYPPKFPDGINRVYNDHSKGYLP